MFTYLFIKHIQHASVMLLKRAEDSSRKLMSIVTFQVGSDGLWACCFVDSTGVISR
jgi:hypothetical protein